MKCVGVTSSEGEGAECLEVCKVVNIEMVGVGNMTVIS